MSSVRSAVWVVLLVGLLPTFARADSMTTAGWTVYYTPTPAAQDLSTSTPVPAPSPSTADAFLNFGSAPYSEQSVLTVGTAQPWYDSPAVTQAYGHIPTTAEQASFTSEVLHDVQTTYALAGLNPVVTTDPTIPASHTISIVSGLSYAPNPNAIGITDVGHDGFGFIDKLSYATNPDQLAWAVAHNVSHELMHAFGVAIHADQTGSYLDAASATWNLLTDPTSTFSPAAIKLITATNFGPSVTSSATGQITGLMQIDGDQEILAVPEPSTLAAWSFVALGAFVFRRRHAS